MHTKVLGETCLILIPTKLPMTVSSFFFRIDMHMSYIVARKTAEVLLLRIVFWVFILDLGILSPMWLTSRIVKNEA
jgi:hypothetical protein